ncbi:MAG: hypothetical protein KC613_18845, partial [Myxococcales bacterium]|nr:hypothetical protein [Myxococcales bacterium]
SCFSENQGAGVDLPVPARRDNVGGVARALGAPYAPQNPIFSGGDYLEGEDSCDSTSDFTVDLDDRGMDSEQSDGTDWGEDDGARKCGRSGLATGQWFLFARERRAPSLACPADDPLEDDDAAATALPIRVGPTWHRIICGADEDWHQLTGVADTCYQITLRFRDVAGDIDVIAYDTAGAEIGRAATVTDDEVLTVRAPADGIIRFKVRGWLFGANGFNEYTLQLATAACP